MSYKISMYSPFSYKYLILSKAELSDTEVDEIFQQVSDPTWTMLGDDAFRLLANFNNKLSSSKIDGIGESLTRWSIYRREQNKTKLTLVGNIEDTVLSVTDPMAGNGKEYSYYVYPETDSFIGEAVITDFVENSTNWGYTISDLTRAEDGSYVTNNVWLFRSNVTSSDMDDNVSINHYDTLGRFGRSSRGTRRYYSTSLSALLDDVEWGNGDYDTNIDKLNAWRDFITGSDMYIFKDRAGDVRIVEIDSNPSSRFIDELPTAIANVTFSVREIMDVADVKTGVVMSYDSSVDKTYVHEQDAASQTWVCYHELSKYPEVTVVNSDGIEIFAEIEYVNYELVEITFNTPMSGMAFFS